MDRGFTFKLISNFMNMITATDSKVRTPITTQTPKQDPGIYPLSIGCDCALIKMSSCCNRQVLSELKFEFLREVCNHEHYIPLSLPLPSARITGRSLCQSAPVQRWFCHFHASVSGHPHSSNNAVFSSSCHFSGCSSISDHASPEPQSTHGNYVLSMCVCFSALMLMEF